jgi:hypothetical protein
MYDLKFYCQEPVWNLLLVKICMRLYESTCIKKDIRGINNFVRKLVLTYFNEQYFF